MSQFNGMAAEIETNKNKVQKITKESTSEQYPSVEAVFEFNKNDCKSFVFDTEAHLLGWVGQNLCPMPEEISNAICEVTHNDNGTFNVVANSTGSISLPFGTITLGEGTYIFTRYNCNFFVGEDYNNPITDKTSFVVEKGGVKQLEIYYRPVSGDNYQNAWIQITKGETIPETFVPYYEPYEREDGVTNEILSAGDLLLTKEPAKPAYWWDGAELKKLVDLSTYATKDEVKKLQTEVEGLKVTVNRILEILGSSTSNTHLLSSDGYTLQDKNGLYLKTKESA